jgi:hypothetical protein
MCCSSVDISQCHMPLPVCLSKEIHKSVENALYIRMCWIGYFERYLLTVLSIAKLKVSIIKIFSMDGSKSIRHAVNVSRELAVSGV